MYPQLLHRYIWLLDTILQAKKITLKEINKKWQNSQLNIEGEPLPTRTFHNHRLKIEELFDVNIECQNKHYYIENEEDITTNKVRNWLLNSFTVSNILQECKSLMHRILLEDIPSGREHLNQLINAMQQNKVLQLSYQSFFKDHSESFLFLPYCLKIFKQRWYIVGLRQDLNEIRIYGLDRITALETTNNAFEFPKNFDSEEYFANSYGIFADHSIPVEEVQIKAYGEKQKYLKSLPLHHSQTEVEQADNYTIFAYKVRPTYDFCQVLLSHSNEIEVLSPPHFRDKIKNTIKAMYHFYE